MAAALTQLTTDFQQKLATLTPDNEVLRQNLLQTAKKLVAALESPADRVEKMYPYTLLYMTSRMLVDTGVYRTLAKSDKPQSAAELGKATGVDPALLERWLKFVACEKHVEETGPDQYAPNDTTRLFAASEGEGAVIDTYNCFTFGDVLPAYFKERGYKNPTSADESTCYYRYKLHYFEWMNQPGNEDKIEHFKGHMRLKTLSRKWFEQTEIIDGIFGGEKLSAQDVLLVDVGGNDGYDIKNFHKAHPKLGGRLILQDLEQIINSVDSKVLADAGIEAMAHDMFKPQPVKGAKVYYEKQVLHDWPNKDCQRVLENLRDAMTPGYSRILLNEMLIPEVGAGWIETSVDILMMVFHAAQERKEREWRSLVDGVGGLKVRNIWKVDGAIERIVEIERV